MFFVFVFFSRFWCAIPATPASGDSSLTVLSQQEISPKGSGMRPQSRMTQWVLDCSALRERVLCAQVHLHTSSCLCSHESPRGTDETHPVWAASSFSSCQGTAELVVAPRGQWWMWAMHMGHFCRGSASVLQLEEKEFTSLRLWVQAQ